MRIFALKTMIVAAGLALAGTGAWAAPTNTTAPAPVAVTATPAADAAAPVAAAKPADPTLAADGSQLVAPTVHVGQPSDKWFGMQEQVTKNGERARWFHDTILVPLITLISLFVLGLLIWVMYRFRASKNPTPAKTSHNVPLEIAWTLIPVLILAAIALPSIRLLAAQFKPAPKEAITLKAIGNQWYWTYEYPDLGVNLTSNLLKEQSEVPAGTRFRTDKDGPRLLAVDQRVILPVGVPIRLQTTAADVIHSWAIPAFWIKLDAVPGRLNETSFTIDKPGLYFGQCSELCGARHGYMPIAVEAVSKEQFAAWVAAKGGKMPAPGAAAAASTPPVEATDAAANDSLPIENETADPAVTNQAATANPGI